MTVSPIKPIKVLVLVDGSGLFKWNEIVKLQAKIPGLEESVEWIVKTGIPDRGTVIKEVESAVDEHQSFQAAVLFNVGKPGWGKQDEEILSPLINKAGLKLAVGPGSGYDHVDVDYLTANGITYANTPLTTSSLTADATVMLILQACRASTHQEASLRAGKWVDRSVWGKDHRDLTLGIVGMGRIGLRVAGMMTALGSKRVVYSKRTRLSEDDTKTYEHLHFEELLTQSDIIVLTVPLSPATKHLLDAKAFSKMKDGVIIVNTSRGPVIDENALVEALDSGKVLRAALDVYENEPEVHPGLLKSTSVTLLPHYSAFVDTVSAKVALELLNNVFAFSQTGKPNTPVNL